MTIEQMRVYLSTMYPEPFNCEDGWCPSDKYGNDANDAYYSGWDHAERAMAAHLISLIDGPTQP